MHEAIRRHWQLLHGRCAKSEMVRRIPLIRASKGHGTCHSNRERNTRRNFRVFTERLGWIRWSRNGQMEFAQSLLMSCGVIAVSPKKLEPLVTPRKRASPACLRLPAGIEQDARFLYRKRSGMTTGSRLVATANIMGQRPGYTRFQRPRSSAATDHERQRREFIRHATSFVTG